MTSYGERLGLILTPFAAMAAVALGLRLGAGSDVRAAVVYGAPSSGAATGLAWQVMAFREESAAREPMRDADLDVVARAGTRTVSWHGRTSEDGVAEMLLALPSADGMSLEVRSGTTLLARGDAAPMPEHERVVGLYPAWARFARREGAISLDVAVLGQRVAPGFPAHLWVRAADATTHAPVAGISVDIDDDPSLAISQAGALTDSRGWAHLAATPVGLAVALTLRARALDGRTGEWVGGLFVSPGAASLETRVRWAPGEEPEVDVFAPTDWANAYVEIDDARGRAWAAAVPLAARPGYAAAAGMRVPKLAPGLYWAVASHAPGAAAELGPGTTVRPFFVASSDNAALAFGLDPTECTPPRDVRETARAVSVCLALAAAAPLPRWTALEGFSMKHAHDEERRAHGLAVALGALLAAVLLEGALLLRSAAKARLQFAEHNDGGDARATRLGRAWTLATALLVALLGFLLLSALLLRSG